MMIDKDSLKAMMNYTNGLVSFVNYRRESLMYLEKTDTELHRLVYGLENKWTVIYFYSPCKIVA